MESCWHGCTWVPWEEDTQYLNELCVPLFWKWVTGAVFWRETCDKQISEKCFLNISTTFPDFNVSIIHFRSILTFFKFFFLYFLLKCVKILKDSERFLGLNQSSEQHVDLYFCIKIQSCGWYSCILLIVQHLLQKERKKKCTKPKATPSNWDQREGMTKDLESNFLGASLWIPKGYHSKKTQINVLKCLID